MSEPSPAALKFTALHASHRGLHGKMVPFGGWEMPVEYSGILPEHRAVRQKAGLFDVSHMGELSVRGPHALALVQHVTSNDAARLQIGQAQYAGLMTARGTFVDDLLVHKFGDDHYWLVVNASNCGKDFDYIRSQNRVGAQVENWSDRYTQLALQGPLALEILQPMVDAPLAPIRYYWFVHARVLGVEAVVARTGYTGEDGFELYFDPKHSERIWNALLEAGTPRGMLPCGLGARNTLRLEAGMPLYGHEIDDTTTPLEAGLGWIAKLTKPDFLGRDALAAQARDGIRRRLVGFEMTEPGIARDGYPVHAGESAGTVTSGGPAPALGTNIGMTYLPVELAEPGGELRVQIRAREARARIVPLPFYKRPRTS